ncbi:MAG: formimidoylglutamate deiminase [Gemmatimonadota bacterium]|nr:formimidoylglutamate deiminase [Gemmatimonadota bacterium]MDH5760817.1 formimidoylglutamate deiminase [Gemmatimonadota bacterium]
MPDLFLPTALLPDGWATDVRLRVSDGGDITAVHVGSDARGARSVPGITVPGVPNLHSHAFQRAMAGLTERGSPTGDTFWTWRRRMYAFLDALTPDDVEAVARQLYSESLRHGFTSVGEFHYLRNAPDGTPYVTPHEMGARLLAAASAVGMGMTLLPVVYRTSDFGGAAPTGAQRRFVATVSELLDDVAALEVMATAAGGNARAGMALHSLRAVPPDALAEALSGLDGALARAPIHIHVAEQAREVEACLAWSGARPVDWLLDHAPVDPRWCLVHATHMTPDETARVASSGAVVGLCPTTESNLGDGVFPFPGFAGNGGRWGVGTDSHVSVSPVAELRTLEYGQRLTRQLRNVTVGPVDASTGRALLEGAWAGGAQACGRPVGRIAEGSRADLVALDPEHPALVGREGDAVLDSWIFSGEDTPVRDVMVGGRWVVEEGRTLDQDSNLEAYRRVARRITRPT